MTPSSTTSPGLITRIAHLIPCAMAIPTILSFDCFFPLSVLLRFPETRGGGEEVTKSKTLLASRMMAGRGGEESTVSTVYKISCSYHSDQLTQSKESHKTHLTSTPGPVADNDLACSFPIPPKPDSIMHSPPSTFSTLTLSPTQAVPYDPSGYPCVVFLVQSLIFASTNKRHATFLTGVK